MLSLKDGSVLLYGSFDQIGGIEIEEFPSPPLFYNRPGMARIRFPSNEVTPIHALSEQSLNVSAYDSQIDGQLLLPGHYSWGDQISTGVQVWEMDIAKPDPRYDFGLGVEGYVNDAAFARNGDIYLAGNLESFNGVNVGSLIRIHGEPVTVIEAIDLDAEGNFQFTVRSSQGVEYVLESSTDMMSWQLEMSETAQQESLRLIAAPQGSYRFYRVVRLP